MPIIHPSTYVPPRLLRNAHLQTIYPTLCRRVARVRYVRERIETPDGDFLDLDWAPRGAAPARGLVIISHGLEGSSASHYVRGMAHAVRSAGWDALAWNYRGCSGEPNRLLRSYHSGATGDLATVVQHALARHARLALVGFSMGGNLTLKYLGEAGAAVHPGVVAAVAFSAPCDLGASSRRIGHPSNRLYMARFLLSLRRKLIAKRRVLPGRIDLTGYHRMRTFKDFDDRYTAPFNGFRDAEDYWTQASSRPYLPRIRVPTLIVSARNDPFLTPECFPEEEAAASEWLHLEAPLEGGHVGFASFRPDGRYWSEVRVLDFIGYQRA